MLDFSHPTLRLLCIVCKMGSSVAWSQGKIKCVMDLKVLEDLRCMGACSANHVGRTGGVERQQRAARSRAGR